MDFLPATLQDLLVYAIRSLALYAVEGRKVGVRDREDVKAILG